MGTGQRRWIALITVLGLVAAAAATPTPVGADANQAHGAPAAYRSLSLGFYRTCGILDNGTVKCWGRNQFGQLGLGDVNERGDGPGEMGDILPVNLGIGRTARAIAAGEYHTCVLLDNGTVKCWGPGLGGRLGYGDAANRGDGAGEMGDSLPTVNLGTGATATAVTAATPTPARSS